MTRKVKLKLPRFSAGVKIPKKWDPHPLPHMGSRLQIQIVRHGWQADPRENFLART